jgi:hypothetical protein
MMSWPDMIFSVNWNRYEKLFSGSIMKWYVDWNVCDRKLYDKFEVQCGLEQMKEDDVMT